MTRIVKYDPQAQLTWFDREITTQTVWVVQDDQTRIGHVWTTFASAEQDDFNKPQPFREVKLLAHPRDVLKVETVPQNDGEASVIRFQDNGIELLFGPDNTTIFSTDRAQELRMQFLTGNIPTGYGFQYVNYTSQRMLFEKLYRRLVKPTPESEPLGFTTINLALQLQVDLRTGKVIDVKVAD